MATKKDRARIELTTERVRERIAWLELRSSQVQLKTAWVRFATVGIAGFFAILLLVLRL